jgi:hypothetical protein
MNASTIRFLVFSVGCLGFAGFGGLWVASFVDPMLVERLAREVIRYEVEQRTHERVEALDQSFLVQQAERLVGEKRESIEATKQLLLAEVPARVAAVTARMLDADCACRQKMEGRIRGWLEGGIHSATQAIERLDGLVRAKYQETVAALTREFRIFTGTNAAVFFALCVAVAVKRSASVLLLPAAGVLVLAAAVTAYVYLFQQNWLHSLLFGEYVGMAYIAYLAGTFAFLADVLFNRGRITARLLQALLDGLGSAAIVSPC